MTSSANSGDPPGGQPEAQPKVVQTSSSHVSPRAVNVARASAPMVPKAGTHPRRDGSASIGSVSSEEDFTRLPRLNSQGLMSPTGQMHSHDQGSPDNPFLPNGLPSPYDQMSHQRYFGLNPPTNMTLHDQVHNGNSIAGRAPYHTSHISSNGQIYSGLAVVDRHALSTMSPQSRTMPSHLASPPSSATRAGTGQRYNTSSAYNSPEPDQSRSPEAQTPHAFAPHIPSSRASQSLSPDPDMVLRQPDMRQDRSSLHHAKPVPPTEGQTSSLSARKHNLAAEGSLDDDFTSIPDIAEWATTLADPQEEARVQQIANGELAARQQATEQPMIEQSTAENLVVELSKAGQQVVRQPVIESTGAQKTVDQQSAAPQSEVQAEKSMKHQEQHSNLSNPHLSLSSAISDFENGAESDPEKEEMDHESRDRAATPSSDKGIGMVNKYAFNFVREAYNHRVPHQLTTGVTIQVGSLAALTTSLKQRREATGVDIQPSLLPHPNEFQKSPKTIECVWIGMLPSQDALRQIHSKADQPVDDAGGEGSSMKLTKKRVRKTNTVGDMREDEVNVIDFDRNALRVVVKKSDKVTRDTHIYALLNPNSVTNLCQGFKVGFDDVFYFPKFRDDTTKSVLPRKQATIAKVRSSAFPGDALAVLQSPAPIPGDFSIPALSAESPASSLTNLSNLSTPSPFPKKLSFQSTKTSTDEATRTAPSASNDTFNKNPKKAKSIKSTKRKAQEDLLNVMLKQRDEARKKARAEGYYVSPSDSEVRESVEDSDGGTKDLTSDYLGDVDELVIDPVSSDDVRMDFGFEEGNIDDDEAYPEHAVGARDPGFLSHTENLIKKLARVNKIKVKGPKAVSFRGQNDQVVDKNSNAVNTIGTDRDGYDGDDEGRGASTADEESAALVQKIKAVTNDLAASQDVVGLQQALAIVQCLQDRRGPPKTNALGLYFNVPNSKDIEIEACSEQLKQLRVCINSPNPRLPPPHVLYFDSY